MKRHPHTLNDLLALTMANLRAAYADRTKLVLTAQEFHDEVLVPIFRLDDGESDEPLDILMQSAAPRDREKGVEHVARLPIGAIVLSATYFCRAGLARDRGQMDFAWSCLADARYWCGVAIGQKGVDAALQKSLAGVKRDLAKTGGKARADRYAPIKEFAFGLVKSQEPASGWKSRSQAVKKIKNEVQAYAKQAEMPLSEDQAPTTIDGWLASMPDADQIFPKKKKSAATSV